MQLNLANIAVPILLRPATPLTDDELMRFSEENRPYKIERTREGDLTIMTPTGFIGGTHELYVVSELRHWAELDGRGIAVGPNAGFNLPDGSCLAPDAAWVSHEVLNRLTDEEKEVFPPICPEFVVEVRSRTDSRRLLEAKMQLWLDNGALLAWLVDPVDGNITIYKSALQAEKLERPSTIVASDPVAGFELRCAPLWGHQRT